MSLTTRKGFRAGLGARTLLRRIGGLLLLGMVVLAGALLPSSVSAQSWFDTFNDGSHTDGNPLTWSVNPLNQFPGDYSSNGGDFVFRTSPNVEDQTMVAWVNSVSFANMGSVRTQVRLLDDTQGADGGGNIGPMLFFNRNTVSGYVGAIDAGGVMYLVASHSGVIDTLGEFSTGINTYEPTILQIDHDGVNLSFSAWPAGQRPPARPQIVVQDTTFTQGTAGLVFLEDNAEDIGVFEYARASGVRIVDGDINEDGVATSEDIDTLFANLDSDHPIYDVNLDGTVNAQDVDSLVRDIFESEYGDADLDGRVDALDWQTIESHLFESSTGWSTGDFNGDGTTDGQDFHLWLDHHVALAAADVTAVPEPHAAAILLGLIGCAAIGRARRRPAIAHGSL